MYVCIFCVGIGLVTGRSPVRKFYRVATDKILKSEYASPWAAVARGA